jgi:hypothetical protein
MSLSIEELDATVRAFYEGRGETVCIGRPQKSTREKILADQVILNSKNKLKLHSTR